MDNGLAPPPTTPTGVMTSLQIETQSFTEKLDHLSNSHKALLAELAARQVKLNIHAELLLRNQELLEEKEKAAEVKKIELKSGLDSLDQQKKRLMELEKVYKDNLSLAEAKQVEHETLTKELEEREKTLLTKEESLNQLSVNQGLKAEELATREKALRADEELADQLLNNLALQSRELAARENAIGAKEVSVKEALENQAIQALELAAREKLILTKEEVLDAQAQDIMDRQSALEAEENSMKEKSHTKDIKARCLESRAVALEESEVYLELREKAFLEREENLNQRETTLLRGEEKIGDSNGSVGSDKLMALESTEEEMLDLLQSVDAFNEFDLPNGAAYLGPSPAHPYDLQPLMSAPDTQPIHDNASYASSKSKEDLSDFNAARLPLFGPARYEESLNVFIAARLPLFGPTRHDVEDPSPTTTVVSPGLDEDGAEDGAGGAAGDIPELHGATKTAHVIESQVSNEDGGMAEDLQKSKNVEGGGYLCGSQDVPSPVSPPSTTNLAFCCAPSLLGAVADNVSLKELTGDVTTPQDPLNTEADAPESPFGVEAEIAPTAASEDSGLVQDTAPFSGTVEDHGFAGTAAKCSGPSQTLSKSKKEQNADKHARQKAKRAAVRVQAQLDKILQSGESQGQSKEQILKKLKSLADATDVKKMARLFNIENMVDEVSRPSFNNRQVQVNLSRAVESQKSYSTPPPSSQGSRNVSGQSTSSSTNSKSRSSSVMEGPVQLPHKTKISWAEEMEDLA